MHHKPSLALTFDSTLATSRLPHDDQTTVRIRVFEPSICLPSNCLSPERPLGRQLERGARLGRWRAVPA
jgi:hypothetical protein